MRRRLLDLCHVPEYHSKITGCYTIAQLQRCRTKATGCRLKVGFPANLGVDIFSKIIFQRAFCKIDRQILVFSSTKLGIMLYNVGKSGYSTEITEPIFFRGLKITGFKVAVSRDFLGNFFSLFEPIWAPDKHVKMVSF